MKRAALAVALISLAAVAAGASAAPQTTRCQGSQLRGSVHGSSGAAGTIAYSLAFRNASHTACLLRGYPGLKLVGVPTRTQHGGLPFLTNQLTTPTALAPGRYASLLLAYSDVPTGAERHCPTTHRLLVTPPGSQSAVTVTVTIMACNRGLLRESAFLAGLRPAP